jgi:hypothetical protein
VRFKQSLTTINAIKRPLTMAGVLLAAVAAIVTGPAGAASAGPPGTELLNIIGSFTVVDDDWDYDTSESDGFERNIFLTPANPTEVLDIVGPCAGGEVRGELHLLLTRQSDGQVTIATPPTGPRGLHMYEGTFCQTTDLDGIKIIPTLTSRPFSTIDHTFSVGHNQGEVGDDSVTAFISVHHTR